MSQKTLNLCLERYNFVKFGETTKSSHTVLCINNAYSVNSDKYRLTPAAIASKHGDGYVFTLNYDFDRPLFTIVQKSYTLDGTSGNIVFEGIDPISKGGSKYLRKVTVSPVKLSDGSYLLEVTKDEYLRIGTTGAALGDEELESLNEKIVTMGGIEKSVETVGGKQVLKLDAGGPSGAKEIVYFDVDPSDPPSGIYDDITVALSNEKEPVIKIDDAVYFYTATGTDKYVFVGGYTKEAVGYTEIEVSDDDSVTSKSVDDKVFNMYMLYRTDPASPGDPPGTEDQPGAGFWVCDENKHVITKAELLAAHADCRYFVLNNDIEPDSNCRKYFASVTVISNSDIRILFYMTQTDDGSAAEFTEKLVMADSEGRLYVLRSYEIYLAGTNNAVLVSEPQSFNATQKAQGRDNIGAASASDVTALQSQVSSLSDVSAYSVKGEATVAQLNAGPSGIQAGWAYQLTDSGTLTDGSLAVVAGDTVAWDGTKWFPLVKSDYYATKQEQAALTTYAQNVAHSIAPEFDPTRTSENPYKAGETVTYIDGKTYTFTAPHYGEWTGTDVEEEPVMSYIDVRSHEKLADLTFSDGAFVNASGIESSSSSYKVTGYISLKPNGLRITSVFVKVMLNSSIYICFYDKYKRFLSSSSVESNSNIVYEDVLAAPAKAAFVRISCVKTYPDALTYIGIGSISSLESFDSGVDDVRGIVKIDNGVNHVDYSAIATNRYIQADGTEKSFSGLNSTDFIPMEQGVSYNFDKLLTNYYAFYDAKYALVASYDTLGTLTSPFTIPVGAVYGRFGLVDNSVANRLAVLWKGSVAKDEVRPYLPRFVGIASVPSYNSVTDDEVQDESVSLSKIKGCTHSEESNYLKEPLWVDGYYIDANGAYHASSGLLATKNIPLEAGKSYYHYNLVSGYYGFYAADGTVIEAHGNDSSLTSPFVAPVGTSFGRFTTTTSRVDGAWLSSRDEVPVPYYRTLPKEYRSLPLGDPDNPCEYPGKDICAFAKGLCIGDSLTAGTMNYDDDGAQGYVNIDKNSYPSCLARMTGLEVTNKGNGGATSAEWFDLHKNEDLSGYDFAIIQLGVNDVTRYGTWGQTSEEAFDAIIAKLKGENKNIKIFVANILPLTWFASNSAYKAFSDALSEYVEGLNDEDVVLLDMHRYSHVRMSEAYNCGHLSGYGYWRLAADYIGYIGYCMNTNKMQFREIQFIGTDYVYDT